MTNSPPHPPQAVSHSQAAVPQAVPDAPGSPRAVLESPHPLAAVQVAQEAVPFSPQAALEFELQVVATMERVIRAAQAVQYRCLESARGWSVVVEGVTEHSSAKEREFATRSFIAEVATTLVVHEVTASRLVHESERLNGPRSATLDALDRGELSATQMRSVLELTQELPAEVADEVERVAVEHAPTCTNTALRRRLHRVRERMHPDSLEARRRRASDERRVCLDAAPDGMAWLSVFLEADRATAIIERLDALSKPRDAARGAGGVAEGVGFGDAAAAAGVASVDLRTPAQRAADVAADLLLSGTLAGDTRTVPGSTGAVTPTINVTVPVMTLLGLSDEPAELDGYGPIDPDTARRLAAHAPSLRRILVHPETGAYLSYGRASYRAPADLAGYLRVRDGQCRFPGCSRRARRSDIDHTEPWAGTHPTEHRNLAHLCRKHHRLKHASGWRVVQEHGGVMRWTSPAGHVLRTYPEHPFTPVPAHTAVEQNPAEPKPAEPPEPPDPPGPPPEKDAGRSEALDRGIPDEPPW